MSYFRRARGAADGTTRTRDLQQPDVETQTEPSVEKTSIADGAQLMTDQSETSYRDQDRSPPQDRSMSAEIMFLYQAVQQIQKDHDEVPSMLRTIDKRLAHVQRTMQSLQSPEQVEADEMKIKGLENDLKEANGRADEAMKRWRKAASKLGQQQPPTAVTDQLSDSDLISLISQLRYKIRAFAGQFFSGIFNSQNLELLRGDFSHYMLQDAKEGTHQYPSLLLSETKGPFVIQSFLWQVLNNEVFNRYHWAPKLRHAVESLQEASEQVDEKQGTIDAEQKFHIWRSTTANHALKWTSSSKRRAITDAAVIRCSRGIHEILKPVSRVSDEQSVLCDIRDILDAAIDLDQEICKHVAFMNWYFPKQSDSFTADIMRVEPGAPAATQGELVEIITAPALIKLRHSKSKFKLEDILLQSDVVCVSSSSSGGRETEIEPRPLNKSARSKSMPVAESSGSSNHARRGK
ncbi:hypothetical protein F5Y16DRAFT_374826 [Xylariaceae sp. FL0255]|nr:hypothetical protein F5Y16DRAFT_374826 [Xylariaceae sp. FL0255]